MRPSPLFVSASQYVQHGAVGKLFVTSGHKVIKNSITICKVGIFREEKKYVNTVTGWPYKSKNFTFDKKNNRQLIKKSAKSQIALNDYNVFFDIFLNLKTPFENLQSLNNFIIRFKDNMYIQKIFYIIFTGQGGRIHCVCSADLPFLLVCTLYSLLYALKSFCLHFRFPGFEFIIDREKDGIFGRDLFEVKDRRPDSSV